MAKIPLANVPQAPETVRPLLTELPTPNVTYAEPAQTARIQYPGPINVSPVSARMQETTDYEKHIRGLQQREMDAPYEKLFAANSAIGQNLMNAGQQIGGQLMSMGYQLQQSKDQADISRAKSLWTKAEAGFAEEIAEKNITNPHQQLALWESKWGPQYMDGVKAIGMSAYTTDRVMPEVQANFSKTRTALLNEGNVFQAKQDQGAIMSEMEEAAARGDLAAQLDANTRLTLAGGQTPMAEAQRRGQIKEAHYEWEAKEVIAKTPEVGYKEMLEIEQTGTSDVFPNLKNPATVARLKNEARTEMVNRDQDAEKRVADGIVEGNVKNRDDIISSGGSDLRPTTIASLEKLLIADPQFSTKSISEINTLIKNYDPRIDDPEGMPQYRAILDRIYAEVPKDIQGNLKQDLYTISQKAVEKGEFPTPKQHFAGELENHIERLGKLGTFDPEGYSTKKSMDPKETKYAIEHRADEEEVWKKIEQTKGLMRQWLVDNPEKDETAAMKYLQELTGPEVKATAAQEWKARPEPSHPHWIEPFRRNPTIPVQEPKSVEERRAIIQQYEPSLGTKPPTPETKKAEGPTTSKAIPQDLINKVKVLEGYNPNAYWDSGQYSIGYGTRATKGETLTQSQAEARLRSELSMHAGNVDQAAQKVGMRLTKGQRDALISFDFNTGRAEYLITSANGDIDEIRRRMPSWNKAEKGGPPSPGLVNRRNAELAMFNA